MKGRFKTAAVIAMTGVMASPCVADPCHGDAQSGVYNFEFTQVPANAPINAKATLSISAAPPGLTFMPAADPRMVNVSFGATYVKVFFDVYNAGLAPKGVEVVVYYPNTLTGTLRVLLAGPFGSINAQASRPAPIYNDVDAHFPLTPAQLSAFKPGTKLSITIFDQNNALLELGSFNVPDVATLGALGDVAAADLNKKCPAGQ